VAVYLVLLFHAGVGWFTGGFVGVDLFFVLSGFLVAQVVLREVDHRGRLPLCWFYSRRVRRLLPAATLVVVLTAALQVLVISLPLREELVDDARASLLYYANWHFIAESRDYFAAQDAASPFLHFWSLSIEEQFYIAFPLVVLAAYRWARRPARVLAMVVGALGTASLGLQVWRAVDDPGYAYYATETRVYQLAAGVLLALGTRALVARGGVPGARAVGGTGGARGPRRRRVRAGRPVALGARRAGRGRSRPGRRWPVGCAVRRHRAPARPAGPPLPRPGLLRHLPVALAGAAGAAGGPRRLAATGHLG
jgi:peptidoglycan/LPS O-acetylase OafA/YrhL